MNPVDSAGVETYNQNAYLFTDWTGMRTYTCPLAAPGPHLGRCLCKNYTHWILKTINKIK